MNNSDCYQYNKVQVAGTSINYVKVGKGPSVVFVHGWCNNWFGWIPLVSFLKDFVTLYLIDLPGFGDSGKLEYYSIEQEASYLTQFIELLPEKPVSVVGLSMGSLVVAHMAKARPDLTHSVVLAGPILRKGKRAQLIAKALSFSFQVIDLSDLVELFIKTIVEQQTTGYTMAKYVNMYKFDKFLVDTYGTVGRKKMKPQAFVQMGSSIGDYDLKRTLENYSLPVLLLYGHYDKLCSPQVARDYFMSEKSLINIVEIPEAGHIAPIENPKESADAITSFLRMKHLL